MEFLKTSERNLSSCLSGVNGVRVALLEDGLLGDGAELLQRLHRRRLLLLLVVLLLGVGGGVSERAVIGIVVALPDVALALLRI